MSGNPATKSWTKSVKILQRKPSTYGLIKSSLMAIRLYYYYQTKIYYSLQADFCYSRVRFSEVCLYLITISHHKRRLFESFQFQHCSSFLIRTVSQLPLLLFSFHFCGLLAFSSSLFGFLFFPLTSYFGRFPQTIITLETATLLPKTPLLRMLRHYTQSQATMP